MEIATLTMILVLYQDTITIEKNTPNATMSLTSHEILIGGPLCQRV